MDRITAFLKKREKEHLLRTLKPAEMRKNGKCIRDGKEYCDLSSNDYLGLSQHPDIKKAAARAVEKFGTGSGASRLLSGDLDIFHELERQTAKFKNKPACLVFNSGYQANVGIITSLLDGNSAVFADKLSHASILDGIKQSGARLFRFRHNDTDHLENILKRKADEYENKMIITESVFSMDGDIAPLKELVKIKNKYDCLLMVDEAHATGIFGQTGSGIAEQTQTTADIDLIMGTFSKALGSFGAYLACSEPVKQYLVNNCRSFIYSTALPPSVIAANMQAIQTAQREKHRRTSLLDKAAELRKNLKEDNFHVTGSTQIISVVLKSAERTVKTSDYLKEKGFWALPIRPPTVSPRESRIRISLTCDHDEKIVTGLVKAFKKANV